MKEDILVNIFVLSFISLIIIMVLIPILIVIFKGKEMRKKTKAKELENEKMTKEIKDLIRFWSEFNIDPEKKDKE